MRLTHYDEHKKRWQINDDYGAVMIDELNYAVGEAIDKLAAYEDAEEQGRLVILPCKVGDTVWFYLYENRGGIKKGIYQGIITELKAVQRLNRDAPLFLAFVCFEYPDPWYSFEKLSTSEMHCSFGEYGSWVQFYLTREEAEAALKGETKDV